MRLTGIIPAYAGNTGFNTDEKLHLRDHPRVCGEHIWRSTVACICAGSSPRMRGTPMACFTFRVRYGIIPAYAGNTIASQTQVPRARDHPRVCGEHLKALASTFTSKGSSPRMRGTPSPIRSQKARAGIIPAYAGNTMVYVILHCHRRDHPRVCGEHRSRREESAGRRGSSPRMRGTPYGGVAELLLCGIIPAYAGNTRSTMISAAARGDHPRVCGEHSKRLA